MSDWIVAAWPPSGSVICKLRFSFRCYFVAKQLTENVIFAVEAAVTFLADASSFTLANARTGFFNITRSLWAPGQNRCVKSFMGAVFPSLVMLKLKSV
jgi:hypothetical protein